MNSRESSVMANPADLLVIAPHPDDAEFGIAGFAARCTAEGKQVVYVVVTSGEKGTEDTDIDPKKVIEIREREQEAAARILGVGEVRFLRFPDGLLKTIMHTAWQSAARFVILNPILLPQLIHTGGIYGTVTTALPGRL